MINNNCPLCNSDQQTRIEILKTSDIIRLYKKTLGEDFSYLFNEKIVEYCECQNCRLLHFSPVVTGDEKMYKRLQQYDWYYSDAKEEYQIAKEFLSDFTQAKISVLEVGSGKGVFKSYLKESDSYVGLEFSPEAIQLAKENNVVLYPEMIEQYSVKHPDSYDVVCSFQVLEHVAGTRSFIESCITVLKPGGILIIAVPSEDDLMKVAVNNLFNMPPHHVTRYSDKTLENIAKLFDLKLLAIKHDSIAPEQLYGNAYNEFQHKFLKPRILDLSLKRTLVRVFSKIICKTFRIRHKKITKGSTVVAFYQKKQS